MSPASAPDTNREVTLAFTRVKGKKRFKEFNRFLDELLCFGLSENKSLHVFIEPGKLSKFVNPVGIREKPNIKHDVDVKRKTMLKAERQQRRAHSFVRFSFTKELVDS
jgi:hypothetical protein